MPALGAHLDAERNLAIGRGAVLGLCADRTAESVLHMRSSQAQWVCVRGNVPTRKKGRKVRKAANVHYDLL